MTHDPLDGHVPGFATLAVHAGAQPDPATGARATPIHRTSSCDDVDHAAAPFGLQAFGDIPSRITDPTCAVLEERVAALEGGTAALAVASGQAARQIVFHTLMEPGDEFIASTRLCGGSIDQFDHAFRRFGWHVKWVDPVDPAAFGAALSDRTKVIFVEALANPGGVITDVAAVAAVAKKARVPLVVDNTLASPYLFRPIEHGADIVVHSATEFLCGHGGSLGGVIVDAGTFDWVADERYPALTRPRPEYDGMVLGQTFGNFAFAIACRVLGLRDLGPSLSRFDASMILTGIETLPLRMRRHCDNALDVAAYLSKHPAVSRVDYSGLPDDPYHALARRYLPNGSGAVFTFALRGGYHAGVALVGRLKLFSHLTNVGGTRSLVIHPASTTHRRSTVDQRVAAGVGDDTVRLSVGIEDAADLIADLDQALAPAGA